MVLKCGYGGCLQPLGEFDAATKKEGKTSYLDEKTERERIFQWETFNMWEVTTVKIEIDKLINNNIL